MRAGLVSRAEDWRWGSLWRYVHGNVASKSVLSSWPVRLLAAWVHQVNTPRSEAELIAIRRCIERGCPLGDEAWAKRMVARHGLESTVRPRGRPKTLKKGS